jgi:hypothetical protein
MSGLSEFICNEVPLQTRRLFSENSGSSMGAAFLRRTTLKKIYRHHKKATSISRDA